MEKVEIEYYQHHRTTSGTQRTQAFTPHQIVSLMDKNLLQGIESIYRLKEDGLDPLQFTRFCMNCIPHDENQSPFLATGLSELFEIISNGKDKIKFSQLTDFICQQIVQEDGQKKQLQAKWIPIKGHIKEKQAYLREPPLITGRIDEIYKVWLNNDLLDNGKHQQAISHAFYSEARNKMYCLQSLSDWIGIYSPQVKLQTKIKPSSFRFKKDSAVIGIAFSEREERLGAILKDFSISFWDAEDNYTFQKSISTTKYCQQLQNNIWYLQFFQTWVTADLEGRLYFWNLLEERPFKIIKCRYKAKISDICEIPSISMIGVAQEQKGSHTESAKVQLLSLQKGEVVSEVDTRFQRRMLHTIKYSEQYQVLLTAGYQKKINLFQINNTYLDSWLKGELLGHESAVTCFNIIKKTPMVVSADDRGKVKIWNIKNFKCMQTLDFSDKVSIAKILDMGSEKKIALMGSRIIMLNLENKPQNIQEVLPLKAKSMPHCLLVFTAQDIRKIDFKTGKLLNIDFQFSKAESEVTAMLISSKKEIITGNDKGEISFYCKTTGKLQQTETWHNGSVQYIEEDYLNGLLLTYSIQSGFVVVGKIHNKWEDIRELKGNFSGKELSSIIFSPYHSIIGFIIQKSIFIEDFQQFKILHKLDFENERPTALSFINGLSLLLIATSKGIVYVLQMKNDSIQFLFKIVLQSKLIVHLISDIKCHQHSNSAQLESCFISCSFSDGTIAIVDFTLPAKKVSFKESKVKEIYCNPHRQVREHFQIQLKKIKTEEKINPNAFDIFQGPIFYCDGHANGVTSLSVAEMDEHFLVSTGNDQRIKIWKRNELMGDINVNLPLPYLWNVQLSQEKSQEKRMLQGLEIIQLLFKRFGKDISIGESKLFKTSPNLNKAPLSFLTSVQNSTKKLKRKPTLFQEEFSPADLNYQKIKKQNIIQVGGPSLKRMELTKKIRNLQKEWQIAKEKEQQEKAQLLETIFYKAQKNQEKDTIFNALKDKSNFQLEKTKEEEKSVSAFEERLQASVGQISLDSTLTNLNSAVKSGKEHQVLCKFIARGQKQHKHSNSKRTLQTYFNQKYTSGRLTPQSCVSRSVPISPRLSQCQPDQETTSQINYRKQNNFRIMLKQMRQKLSRSKNGNTQNCSSIEQLTLTSRNFKLKKHKNTSQAINELDQQISTFRQHF